MFGLQVLESSSRERGVPRGLGAARALAILILPGVAALPFPAYGKNPGIQFGGTLGFGANTTTRQGNVEEDYELKIEAKSKRWKGFAAMLELRTDEDSRALTIQDTYIDGKFANGESRVRFGRGRRVLGWEYENPTSRRLSIGRTAISDFMSIRGLAGRDFFARYVWTGISSRAEGDLHREEGTLDSLSEGTSSPPSATDSGGAYLRLEDEAPLTLSGAVHYNETADSAVILGGFACPDENWRFGAWVLIQRSQLPTRAMGSWGGVLSSLYQPGRHRVELEFFSGKDPYRSEVELSYGDGRPVSYWASRLAYGYQFGPVLPYFVGSYISRDWNHPEDRTFQRILGLKFFFNPALSISGEFDTTTNVSISDPTSVSYARNEIRIFSRYFF